MAQTLISFDAKALFLDLIISRVLYAGGKTYGFSYRLYYVYFLGRYIVARPLELSGFIAQNKHVNVQGLVEVISGLSSDNTALVSDLAEKLESAIDSFYETYKIKDLDPYKDLDWVYSEEEEERLWRPVTERLESGPASEQEVDRVKRSILSERKTHDQAIIISDFREREKSVTFNQHTLVTALNNAVEIDGILKVRAAKAIYQAFKIAMQVGFLFSEIIANRRYFSWNGISFINNIEYEEDDDAFRRLQLVAAGVPRAVADNAANQMGSKKLSEVFRYIEEKEKPEGYASLLNFSLLLKSKPTDWKNVVSSQISRTDKRSLYLRFMLASAMKQFDHEVNTNFERATLKHVVAHIKAKRDFGKSNPGEKAIAAAMRSLEEMSYFPDENDKN